jgi:hypothetical protein
MLREVSPNDVFIGGTVAEDELNNVKPIHRDGLISDHSCKGLDEIQQGVIVRL